jgi:hypothetical protein
MTERGLFRFVFFVPVGLGVFVLEDDTMFLSHPNRKLYLKFLRQLEIILFCLKRINVDKLLVILYRYGKAMKL